MSRLKNLFFSISFSEFCGRLSYYGLQALLVLYLANHFGFSMKSSYTLYGNYTALTFACCIIGGIISDKFLTHYQAVFMGILLTMLGNLFLSLYSSLYFLYLGVSFLIVGIGLTKPGTSCLAGSIEKDDLKIKDKIFLYFYTISSAGSILGPLLYGIGISSGKYWIGFFSSFIILIANALIFLFSMRSFKKIENGNQGKFGYALILLFLIGITVYLILSNIVQLHWLFLFALAIFIIVVAFSFFKTPLVFSKKRLILICNLSFPLLSSIIFFVMLLQIYSSITVFIDHTLRGSVLGWHIPVTWYSSIEAFLILIITPCLTLFWNFLSSKKIIVSPQNKILLGIVTTSMAFFMFSLSASNYAHASSVEFLFIVLANLFLGIGELCIIPVSLLLISSMAPTRYQGILMGVFYFLLSFAGYLAGLLAKTAPEGLSTSYNFESFFLNIAFGLLVCTLCLLSLSTCLNKAISSTKHIA